MPPMSAGIGVARLELGAITLEDLALGRALRVAHVDAQHEAVELRFRQWIGAFEVARVLCCQHQEVFRQRIQVALRGHLAFFHGFEQCRLGLGSGAVDFVHQQYVGEQWPAAEHEIVLRRVEHVGADDVAGHQVRGALHALEFAAENARQCFGQQSLAEPGRTLHQHVAARDERDTQRADHVLGADDDARELALDGLFEGRDRGVHVFSRDSRSVEKILQRYQRDLALRMRIRVPGFQPVELLRPDGGVTLEPLPQVAALGACVARAASGTRDAGEEMIEQRERRVMRRDGSRDQPARAPYQLGLGWIVRARWPARAAASNPAPRRATGRAR